jgi:tetratricopeptide (TPR) repeat protein
MIGKDISHFRILERLGIGGMGVVYRAEDTLLKRSVALKFLTPSLITDPEAKQRFIHEARAASVLDHPNICAVHEVGETEDGQVFIVMTYYDGETLTQRIERGPVTVEEALEIAVQVAEGLGKAHAQGITHRDIKPANIMITREGVAKIVDFGLAKLAGQSVVTRAGSTVGTYAYMSPEQARGETVDGRTDVWSLGVTLYEMLTGRRPFQGDYDQALVYSILNEDPPTASSVNSSIPAALTQVIQRAMSKDPQERYQTMEELLADLQIVKGGRESAGVTAAAAAEAKKRRRRVLVRGGMAGVVLALAGTAYVLISGPSKEGLLIANPKPIAVVSFQNQTGDSTQNYLGIVLQDALITSLEQLKYFRITTRGRMADILKQMGKKDVEYVDQATGEEICRREGDDVLLAGNFARAGNLFVTTVKVLDTHTGQTLKMFKATGNGIESLLQSQIDNLSRQVAQSFGVSERSLETNLHPIAGLTSSLEAYDSYLIGLRSRANSDYPSAERLLRKAVELDSTFSIAWFWLGETYFEEGKGQLARLAWDHARTYLQSVPEKDRLHAEAHLYPERYKETILRAIAKYPKEKEFYACYATVGCGTDYRARIENFKKAFALDPEYGWALEGLTGTYMALGEAGESLKYARLLEKAKPQYPWAIVLEGDAYFGLGDLRQAETEYQKALELRAESLTWAWVWTVLRRGYMYALEENYGAFRQLYQREIPSSQFDLVKLTGLFWKAFFDSWLGKKQEAFGTIDQLRAIGRYDRSLLLLEAINTSDSPLIELEKGWIMLDAGDARAAERSIKDFRERFATAQDTVDREKALSLSSFFLGHVALALNQPDSAEQYLVDALAHTENTDEVSRNFRLPLADLLRANILLARDSADQAISTMAAARQWQPSLSADLYIVVRNAAWGLSDVVARAYVKKGEIEKATAEYERLVRPDPQGGRRLLIHPLYYYRLAKLYEREGSRGKALRNYEKFTALWSQADNGRPEIADALASVRRLSRSR